MTQLQIIQRPGRPDRISPIDRIDRTGLIDPVDPVDRTGRALLPIAAPSRRALLLGVGTLGAGLALGTGAATAAPPTLRRGNRGSAVSSLQQNLANLKYWLGAVDGSFGHMTQQAVFALQKAAGLVADGIVGPRTYSAISRRVQPARRITGGVGFEVDLRKQLLIATQGNIHYAFNTSTGSGDRYYSGGRWKTATTPRGDFRMYSLYSRGWQSGPLGNLYRPGYYDRGWAIHGSTSIPSYPASHGCCRLSVEATNMLWRWNWFVKGTRVLIY